jgi:hypothetical protein
MKKPFFFAVLFAACVVLPLAAQELTGAGALPLLNTRQYSEYFGFKNALVDPDDDYIFDAPIAESEASYSNLGGKQGQIDTPLELALFSYYATPRINIRPVNALPANNPRLSGHGPCPRPKRSAVQCFFHPLR